MNIEIRGVSIEEIPRIIEIALRSFWSEYGSYEEAEKTYRGVVKEMWSRQLRQQDGELLAALPGDDIVGFLVFRWWFGSNGWLETMAVDEKWRGKRVGTQLMKALAVRCKERGYRRICFAVDPSDEILRFYGRLNSRKFGELPFSAPSREDGKLQLHYIEA